MIDPTKNNWGSLVSDFEKSQLEFNRTWNKMSKPIQLEGHDKTKERKLSTLDELNKMMEGNEQKLMDAMMSKFYDLPPVKCKAMMQGHVHMLSKFDIEKVKRKIKEVVDYKEIIL